MPLQTCFVTRCLHRGHKHSCIVDWLQGQGTCITESTLVFAKLLAACGGAYTVQLAGCSAESKQSKIACTMPCLCSCNALCSSLVFVGKVAAPPSILDIHQSSATVNAAASQLFNRLWQLAILVLFHTMYALLPPKAVLV